MGVTPRVLSIAGTDPTGGAGIQADLKSIAAFDGYGMAVVTALVAQNTRGVRAVHVPEPPFLRAQLDAVSDDVEIDAIKLGMLHSRPLIDEVAAWIERVRPPIVVLDPVMVATSGDRLLDTEAEQAVRELCRRADLVTPNLPELAVLVDEPVAGNWDAAVDQAERFAADAGVTVLLKGGHLVGEIASDAIVTPEAGVTKTVSAARVHSTSTHGTGCSLSSAMATLRAQGLSWPEALETAKEWLTGAIAAGSALHVGSGNGPIDHFHHMRTPAAGAGRASDPDRWWDQTASVRSAVDECAFVRELGAGSLDRDAFAWYLAQDAVYLGEYARVLARASALAPDASAQAFWARSAAAAVEEEAALHRMHIGEAVVTAGPVTRAYTDHLHASASRGSYAEIVAAVLPCFWLYAEVGAALAVHSHSGHPYRDWLDTYADEAFADATARARAFVADAARTADAATRDRMRRAFTASMEHELAFFRAPRARSDAGVSELGMRFPSSRVG